MNEVEPQFKGPKRKRPKGREDPDRPLNPMCQAMTPVCTGASEARHHLAGRGHSLTLDVCTRCHQYIHAHPAESYEQGWLLRRNT